MCVCWLLLSREGWIARKRGSHGATFSDTPTGKDDFVSTSDEQVRLLSTTLPHPWEDEGNLSCTCLKNAALLTELNALVRSRETSAQSGWTLSGDF